MPEKIPDFGAIKTPEQKDYSVTNPEHIHENEVLSNVAKRFVNSLSEEERKIIKARVMDFDSRLRNFL